MKKEIRIGLTLLLAISIFYLSLTWLRRTQLFAPDENFYNIDFDNVNGLLEGDPVLIRGYTSGRVLRIQPKADRVAVEIALDSKISLFSDAQAEIQIKELMGGKQVALETGSAGEKLMSGEKISGKITLDFSSSFSQFGQIADELGEDRISGILDQAENLIKSLQSSIEAVNPEQITQTFSQSQRVLAQLNQTLYKLNSQLDLEQVDSLMLLAGEGMKKGTRVLEQVDEWVNRFEKNSLEEVEAGVAKLPSLLSQLENGLSNLNAITEKLNNPRSLGGRLLMDESLSRNLDTTLYNLNKTLEVIHSKRVIVGMKRKKKEQ